MNTEPRTRVIFRIFTGADALHNGGAHDVIALFPHIPGDMRPYQTCQSYQHIGQHGAADVRLVERTRLATRAEYRELAAELRAIGYRLDIRARFHSTDARRRSLDYVGAHA